MITVGTLGAASWEAGVLDVPNPGGVCRYTFNDNANLTNSTYINLKERDG